MNKYSGRYRRRWRADSRRRSRPRGQPATICYRPAGDIRTPDFLRQTWGQVAIEVEGVVYGMSHNGYDIRLREKYLVANSYRDSLGVVLRVSPAERDEIRRDLERRIKIGAQYNIVSNSCSTNVADVLETIGILAHDPRFSFTPSSNAGVSPKEVLIAIQRSKRAVKTNNYPKQ